MTTLENALQANTKQLEVLEESFGQMEEAHRPITDMAEIIDGTKIGDIRFEVPALPENFGAYFLP